MRLAVQLSTGFLVLAAAALPADATPLAAAIFAPPTSPMIEAYGDCGHRNYAGYCRPNYYRGSWGRSWYGHPYGRG
ncbi:MAG: hypothetical protein JO001_28500 [Alphaproteobacteria bacterium]|nr:hypothetical protein [Alphaproteobacteria bacterium]